MVGYFSGGFLFKATLVSHAALRLMSNYYHCPFSALQDRELMPGEIDGKMF